MISVTQTTEYGTAYSVDELKQILAIAREHNFYTHLDGARLVYAPQQLKTDFASIVRGFDVVSLGATKNGGMGAEAVLIFNEQAKADFKYKQKQLLQLSSKTRFIAQQFISLFNTKDNLWKSIAEKNHSVAKYLEQQLKTIPKAKVTQPVHANAVFATIPKEWVKPLRDKYFFYVWDQFTTECRFMISFDVTETMIDEFITSLRTMNG